MATQRLPLDQAAARLGCSLSTLRRRIRAGTLQTEREPYAGGFRLLVLVDEPPTIVPADQAGMEQLRHELTTERERADRLLRLLEREQARSELLTQQLVQLTSPRYESAGQTEANAVSMSGLREQPVRRHWWQWLTWAPA